MYSLLFIVSNIFLFVISIVSFYLIYKVERKSFTNNIIWFLLLGITLTIIAQWFAWQQTSNSGFIYWFLNLDDDRNFPAIFAAITWFIIAVILLMHLFREESSISQKIFWLFFSLIFLFISIDDFFAIHETIVYDWRQTYFGFAIILGVICLLAFVLWFRHEFANQKMLLTIFLLSGVILVISGFITEEILYSVCDESESGQICRNFRSITVIEEIFELIGVAIAIIALLLYSQNTLNLKTWQRMKMSVSSSTLLWFFILVAYIFIFPLIEVRVLATPINVEYAQDKLSLIGYWIPDKIAKPGQRIHAFLYWKADETPQNIYHLSAHLLSHPEVRSVTQAERLHIGQIPSSAWLPNMVVRKAVHFDIPENIQTPASYWLSVDVSEGLLGAYIPVPVADSDTKLITENTTILTSISVLPPKEQSTIALTEVNYTFQSDFQLTGYLIPHEATLGETFDLQFQWHSDKNLEIELIHFIHLFHDDTEEYILLDREPFEGVFPTSDWVEGMRVTDTATFSLPEDARSGKYRIHIGMYDTITGERQTIRDENGIDVTDHSIYLTDIMIQEKQ